MLLIVVLATFLPALAQAYDVLVLQSRREPVSDTVLQSFTAAGGHSRRLIVMSDLAEVDVPRLVREDHPRLVLALGDAAVNAARSIRQIPVLALLSLSVHTRKLPPAMSAIGMYAPPARYMELFASLGLKKIGLVYDEKKSGWYLEQARNEARKSGIELVAASVDSARQVPAALVGLADRVDGLWMLPDSTAVSREVSSSWFSTSQAQGIPVISFAPAYLDLGAAAVLELDFPALGRQAAAMAAELISGGNVAAPVWPQSTPARTNDAVVRKQKGKSRKQASNP